MVALWSLSILRSLPLVFLPFIPVFLRWFFKTCYSPAILNFFSNLSKLFGIQGFRISYFYFLSFLYFRNSRFSKFKLLGFLFSEFKLFGIHAFIFDFNLFGIHTLFSNSNFSEFMHLFSIFELFGIHVFIFDFKLFEIQVFRNSCIIFEFSLFGIHALFSKFKVLRINAFQNSNF